VDPVPESITKYGHQGAARKMRPLRNSGKKVEEDENPE